MTDDWKLLLAAVPLAFLACSADNVAAQDVPSSRNAPSRATDRQVIEFKADKPHLLKSNPIGGIQLSSMVKALVLADPSVVDDLLALGEQGNTPQALAIGAGIGQAVKALQVTDRTLADSIAAKVAANGTREVLAGYSIGTSDTATFAVGGGGPGAGGGGFGGPVNSGVASGGVRASQIGSSSFSNPGFSPPPLVA
jgi:hypothetical protein